MVLACAMLSAVCLALFAHPYLTYPVSLLLFPARAGRRGEGPRPASASLLFAAYNEAAVLPAKLANLRAIRASAPALEILAYDDASIDGTGALLAADPALLRVVTAASRTGKATGMRRLVAAARGEICIFTDANVEVLPDAVAALLDRFADPAVGGVAGRLRYVNPRASTTARVGSLYWRWEELLKSLESRSGSVTSADGSIFAVRRALYPEVPAHLLDDMTVSVAVIASGARLVHGGDVAAYEKSATLPVDEFRRKRRIAARAFSTHRHVRPLMRARYGALDRYKYVSHKLLRWFGIVPLALGLVFAAAALAAGGRGGLAATFAAAAAAAYALGRAGVPVLAPLSEALRLNAATFVGVCDAVRGRAYQTWEPAPSRG